jgi:hypothetical protein
MAPSNHKLYNTYFRIKTQIIKKKLRKSSRRLLKPMKFSVIKKRETLMINLEKKDLKEALVVVEEDNNFTSVDFRLVAFHSIELMTYSKTSSEVRTHLHLSLTTKKTSLVGSD